MPGPDVNQNIVMGEKDYAFTGRLQAKAQGTPAQTLRAA